jgi:predicted nucleotidyltransferase
MLTTAEVDEIVRRIIAGVSPETVIVFGSYAKGTATSASDLDVLVIMETELPMSRRANQLRPLFARTIVPVDVHVYTREEVEAYGRAPFTFLHSVLATGRVAYRREGADGRYCETTIVYKSLT